MPNIATYTNPIDHITPSEQGTEAYEQSGMRIAETVDRTGEAFDRLGETLGNAAVNIQRQYNQRLVSQYTAASTSLFANLNDQWNNVVKNTNPNLILQAQKAFIEDTVKPALAKLQPDGYFDSEAHEFAQEHSADMITHFIAKTTADVAMANGQALVINLNQAKDSLSHAVNQDPSSLDYALSTFQKTAASIIGNSHGLTAAQIITARSEVTKDALGQIAFSGIAGAINKNPTAGLALLSAGRYAQYLTTTQAQQLQDYGRTIIRFNETQARIGQALQTLQANEYAKQTYSAAVGSLIGPNGQLQPMQPQAFAEFMHDQNVPGPDKLSMLRVQEQIAAGKLAPIGNPLIATRLLSRLALPPGSPGGATMADLTSALAKGDISSTTFLLDKQVYDAVQHDRVYAENMKAFTQAIGTFQSYIIGASGNNAAQGLIASHAYMEAAQTAYMAGLAKGLKPSDMLDPGGKDYIGSTQMMLPYMNMATQSNVTGPNNFVFPPDSGAPPDDSTAIGALRAAAAAAGSTTAPTLGDGDDGSTAASEAAMDKAATVPDDGNQ